MKKTVITIAITALLTAVLMISGYFIYTKIINKDNNANSNMTKKMKTILKILKIKYQMTLRILV